MKRLLGWIDRGRDLAREAQKRIAVYVETVRQVDALLHPSSGGRVIRKRRYGVLRDGLLDDDDVIRRQMGRIMVNFEPGLFVVGGRGGWPRDNLDLERWFRLPKGHERRLHGRCHAGVRIVHEGATLMLALDAHRQHPLPFTEEELRPYRDAPMPDCQWEVIHRRKIMRSARSKKKRPILLSELEERYARLPQQ